VVIDGMVREIKISGVRGRKPLQGRQLADFELRVRHFADEIVRKWIDYFVLHKFGYAGKNSNEVGKCSMKIR
jgi:hypothetical protein